MPLYSINHFSNILKLNFDGADVNDSCSKDPLDLDVYGTICCIVDKIYSDTVMHNNKHFYFKNASIALHFLFSQITLYLVMPT